MTLLAWVLVLLVLGIAGSGLTVLLGLRQLERLADSAPYSGVEAPLVSIVVAARDEERGIEAAMRSLLAQRYPAFELVAVDDRSGDRTGSILDRLAAVDSRLRVLHIRELPEGWLGKNHALALGAETARGEWLLFTDADVVMHPETLTRAIGFAGRRGIDHLPVLPEFVMPGLLLKAFITTFVISGLAVLRPWRTRDPRRRASAGVGAFNLVRTAAYARAGGHAPIRLRPDDDLKLGKILKASGARQEVMLGTGMISVEWYHSLKETINGLMKNSFSVVEYRISLMLLTVSFYLILALLPLGALLFGAGLLRVMGAVAVATLLLAHLGGTLLLRVPRRAALLYPIVNLLFAWIVLRALVLNLSQRGIVWRGTFYPLAELRRNKV